VRNFPNVKHPIRNFQKCTEKITCGTSKNAPFRCIYGSSSWELLYIGRFLRIIVEFWKFFIGFLEVSYGIFCIFGSSSWDCGIL
jgi:hypothetical protein